MALKRSGVAVLARLAILAVPSYGAMALKPRITHMPAIIPNALAVPSYGAMALKPTPGRVR